jgi:hypothetical protein
MKNIFLLPTDQLTSVLYGKDDKYKLANSTMSMDWFISSAGYKPKHIYITSDEDLILGGFHFNSKYGDEPQKTDQRDIESRKYWEEEYYYISKIILTTDPTLIADGVQSIDDEFLKWFVKNPSCEFVEVNKKLVEFPLTFKMMYKIIIPQEESKQEILPEFKLSKDIFNKLSCLSSKDLSPELKQLVNDNWDYLIGADDVKNEIRYSEDEVRELLIKGLTHNDDKLCGSLVTVQKEIRTANFNVWFEENKKK